MTPKPCVSRTAIDISRSFDSERNISERAVFGIMLEKLEWVAWRSKFYKLSYI